MSERQYQGLVLTDAHGNRYCYIGRPAPSDAELVRMERYDVTAETGAAELEAVLESLEVGVAKYDLSQLSEPSHV